MAKFGAVTPILRIFDEGKAREFYLEFLDFVVRWEHRFDSAAPLYMEVARDSCVLHLSEHHGDATPGSAARIPVDDAAAFQRSLLAKNCRFARPGLLETSWKTREVSVSDPFGNRLHFFENVPAQPGGDETPDRRLSPAPD